MINIAVCDDTINDLNNTKKLIQRYLDENSNLAIRAFYFSTYTELFNSIEDNGSFDIYILDIIMPEKNGIQIGKELRGNGDEGEIIYLSTSSDYAVESYDANAFFYLIKPVSEDKLFSVLSRAIENINNKKANYITIHTPTGLYRIKFDDILFVEQLQRSMYFHLKDGATIVSCIIRKPFASEIEEILKDNRFIICGSSFVINLHAIVSMSKDGAVFFTGLTMPIPTTLYHKIKQKWIEYWIERK